MLEKYLRLLSLYGVGRLYGLVGVGYDVKSASAVQVLKGGMEQEWASEFKTWWGAEGW